MNDLTIIMPSWNKERYIAEALDSVFAQETSFTFEVVVADDHSTDRTLDIVEDYARRYPGKISVLRSDENLKLFRNVRRAYEKCKTPYFCVLDPDDYWTDERHLDKALTFLSSHSDFTIYSAGIEQLFPDGTRKRCDFPVEPADVDFSDYLRQNAFIAYTQTCVYRNVVFSRGLPEKVSCPPFFTMETSFRGDSFRNFLHIREGKAHYDPGIEACYRVTEEGVFQGLGVAARHLLNAQSLVDFWRYDDGRYPQFLAQSWRACGMANPLLFGEIAESDRHDDNVRKLFQRAGELAGLYADHRAEVEDGIRRMAICGGGLLSRLRRAVRERSK